MTDLTVTGRFHTGQELTQDPRSFPTFVRQDTVIITGTVSADDLKDLEIKATLSVFDVEVNALVKVAEKVGSLTVVNPNIQRYQVVIAAPADTESFDPSTFYFDVQVTTKPVALGSVPMVKTFLGGFRTVLDYTLTV